MPRFSLTALRIQAVLWTLLPLTLIMLMVGSVGAFAYNLVVERLVEERDSELARISAARLSENMTNYAGVLNALAEPQQMRSGEFAAQKSVFLTAIQNGLLRLFDGGVSLLNEDGVVVISYNTVASVDDQGNEVFKENLQQIVGEDYSNEDYFTVPARRNVPYFTDIHPHPLTGEPQIIVSVPILNPQAQQGNQFVGILAGAFLLNNETLGGEIANLDVGTAYLVDRTGRAIWHSDETLLGEYLTHLDPVRALLRLDNRANAQTGVNEEGEAIVAGYATVESTGWGLVIQESWEEVVGPIRTFQWIMLSTLLVGLALAMVIISSGTRRLTDPIQALVAQTQHLARGNFAGHVQGGTIDEMRSLSEAFNEMADRVARYRAGMQSYVAAITHSQEDERKRIARELHDDTVQSLIALGRRLELLEQSLENPIEAAKQLYQLQQMVAQTVAEVRQFSRDLRPLLLEDVGLQAAMRQMLREMERRDAVETTFTIEGDFAHSQMDDELEVAVYRIAQEALNNIHKHAHATRVDVTLHFEHQGIRLVVQDDGQGFPLAETAELARRGSFGLMGIRERAKLFGGTFRIESEPGKGTCVTIFLPYDVTPVWLIEAIPQPKVGLPAAVA
jgi:signal transduction histidine kinase